MFNTDYKPKKKIVSPDISKKTSVYKPIKVGEAAAYLAKKFPYDKDGNIANGRRHQQNIAAILKRAISNNELPAQYKGKLNNQAKINIGDLIYWASNSKPFSNIKLEASKIIPATTSTTIIHSNLDADANILRGSHEIPNNIAECQELIRKLIDENICLKKKLGL